MQIKDITPFATVAARIEEFGDAYPAFLTYKEKIRVAADLASRTKDEERADWAEAGAVANLQRLAVSVSPHLGTVAQALSTKLGRPGLAASYGRAAAAFASPSKSFP
jgi:hypothetical protein